MRREADEITFVNSMIDADDSGVLPYLFQFSLIEGDCWCHVWIFAGKDELACQPAGPKAAVVWQVLVRTGIRGPHLEEGKQCFEVVTEWKRDSTTQCGGGTTYYDEWNGYLSDVIAWKTKSWSCWNHPGRQTSGMSVYFHLKWHTVTLDLSAVQKDRLTEIIWQKL